VPRSRVARKSARAVADPPMHSMDTRPTMSEQIGPSMSTEPGWMAASPRARYYLRAQRAVVAINPSMLLSFERPASAGIREDAPLKARPHKARSPAGVHASPRSLKTAQKPQISRHR